MYMTIICIQYWKEISKNNLIYFFQSSNGGITFSQPINLSETTNFDSINPQLAVTANELFVIWQKDISGNNQIYFTKVHTL